MESIGESLYFSLAFGVVVPLSLLCPAVLIYFCCRNELQGESDPDICTETRVISPMS